MKLHRDLIKRYGQKKWKLRKMLTEEWKAITKKWHFLFAKLYKTIQHRSRHLSYWNMVKRFKTLQNMLFTDILFKTKIILFPNNLIPTGRQLRFWRSFNLKKENMKKNRAYSHHGRFDSLINNEIIITWF
jgi:transposase